MPFFDPKELFGWNMDRHLLLQSTPQPLHYASKCSVFERDFVECADALTMTRARKECHHEWEDLMECMHRKKTIAHLEAIRTQRDKLIKEGKYSPPLETKPEF
uniref:NADH dehydrogenase [ubiquinone] iron-sulfur protein 5 n=1 Tax=Myxine glutinosa TaxID=7769 RepID=UPI00358F6EB6